jgi:hypothetical protein
MSREGLGGPHKGSQSVMFHRQPLLTQAPSRADPVYGPKARRLTVARAALTPNQPHFCTVRAYRGARNSPTLTIPCSRAVCAGGQE